MLQKTDDYMMNKVSDFDSIMCDDTPITEPESEPEPEPEPEPRLELQCDPEPLREKAPLRVYEPSNQRIILGVHNVSAMIHKNICIYPRKFFVYQTDLWSNQKQK